MHIASDLEKRFGKDQPKWDKKYTVTLRGDKWFWLIWLAEVGILAKRKFTTLWSRNTRASEKLASLASWEMDLEGIGKQILEQVQ